MMTGSFSTAVRAHQDAVAGILARHGLSAEYDESCGLFDPDTYRIHFFKVLPCGKRFNHDWTACGYAHPGERARRRCLLVQNYLAKVCPEMQSKGECPRGESCTMTHSMFEYWMHPQRYRTKLCRQGAQCTRTFCFFAHSPMELRVELDSGPGQAAGALASGGTHAPALQAAAVAPVAGGLLGSSLAQSASGNSGRSSASRQHLAGSGSFTLLAGAISSDPVMQPIQDSRGSTATSSNSSSSNTGQLSASVARPLGQYALASASASASPASSSWANMPQLQADGVAGSGIWGSAVQVSAPAHLGGAGQSPGMLLQLHGQQQQQQQHAQLVAQLQQMHLLEPHSLVTPAGGVPQAMAPMAFVQQTPMAVVSLPTQVLAAQAGMQQAQLLHFAGTAQTPVPSTAMLPCSQGLAVAAPDACGVANTQPQLLSSPHLQGGVGVWMLQGGQQQQQQQQRYQLQQQQQQRYQLQQQQQQQQQQQ